MNGHQGPDQAGQNAQESHLSYLLNSAGGQGLMGYGGLGGGQRLGFGDASLEEQILQRASALRAEALMQQHQQQAHQRQHLGAALAALQQQHQLSSFAGFNPAHLAALSAQEQEALLGRAAALRELGIAGGPGAALSGVGMDRLQQLELGRLEELERRRQQLAALAGYSGAGTVRPGEVMSSSEQLTQDSGKSDSARLASEKKNVVSATEKTKADLRKTPGTVIVPCRARGMPMDHNFKTAYFVISEDAKHGEDLVCSYFACRNGGVKFRYCAHCMAPVAKRNFCRRHDHGKSDKLPPPDSSDSSVDDNKGRKQSGDQSATGKKVDKAAVVPAPASSLDVLSNAASSSMPSTMKESDAESQAKRKMEMEEDGDNEAEFAHIGKNRRKMWSALLIKRPRTKDPRHLSSWLNEVLTVSDFETPFVQGEITEAKAPTGASPMKHKPGKDEQLSSPMKEKNSNGEKKKRKSDKMGDSEKTDNSRAKKEKNNSKPKEKKAKIPASEKPSKAKEVAKPKEVHPSNEGELNAEKRSEPPKSDAGKSQQGKEEKEESTQMEHKTIEDVTKSNSGGNEIKEKTSSIDDKATQEASTAKDKISKDLEKMSDSPVKKPSSDSGGKSEDDDGFAGSFADWRDRKKDKSSKKEPDSLKK